MQMLADSSVEWEDQSRSAALEDLDAAGRDLLLIAATLDEAGPLVRALASRVLVASDFLGRVA